MGIFRIVLTGGPCAGKTKTLEALIDHLSKTKGNEYKILTIPESATELIKSGIHPLDANNIWDFQDLIYFYQNTKEDITEQAIIISEECNNCIIIYDRALIDNKAYLSKQEQFDLLLDKYNNNEISILDKYNLVIDLISTANGNEKEYNLSSNIARFETLEQAKELDIKTSNAWVGHRNIKIFNSNDTLENKISSVIKLIDTVLNGEQKNEIQKYCIEGNINDFSQYNDDNSKMIVVNELHLDIKSQMGYQYVLKKRTYKNNSSYIFTIKKDFDGVEKIVYDDVIPEKQFWDLILNNGVDVSIKRKELTFIENRQIYKINFYDDCTILEFEENKLNDKLNIPEGIKILEKVEDNDNSLNKTNNSIVKVKKMC